MHVCKNVCMDMAAAIQSAFLSSNWDNLSINVFVYSNGVTSQQLLGQRVWLATCGDAADCCDLPVKSTTKPGLEFSLQLRTRTSDRGLQHTQHAFNLYAQTKLIMTGIYKKVWESQRVPVKSLDIPMVKCVQAFNKFNNQDIFSHISSFLCF